MDKDAKCDSELGKGEAERGEKYKAFLSLDEPKFAIKKKIYISRMKRICRTINNNESTIDERLNKAKKRENYIEVTKEILNNILIVLINKKIPDDQLVVFNKELKSVRNDFLMKKKRENIREIYDGTYKESDLTREFIERVVDTKKKEIRIKNINESIKKNIEDYNESLKNVGKLYYQANTKKDEESAEKKLFRLYTDLVFAVDVINRRSFWNAAPNEEEEIEEFDYNEIEETDDDDDDLPK